MSRSVTINSRIGVGFASLLSGFVLVACGSGGADDVGSIEGSRLGHPIETPSEGSMDLELIDSLQDKDQCLVDRSGRGLELWLGGGDFNPWPDCPVYCPDGSYAYSIKLKSLAKQGSGDDKSITGVLLGCNNPSTGASVGTVGRHASGGTWMSWSTCPHTGMPLKSGMLKHDGKTSGSDDKGATVMEAGCFDASYENHELMFPEIQPDTDWGSWIYNPPGNPDAVILPGVGIGCPEDQAICGLEVSAGQDGSSDLVGIDLVNLLCCDL